MNTMPASVTKPVSGERPLMMYILTNHVGDASGKERHSNSRSDFRSDTLLFRLPASLEKNAKHPKRSPSSSTC